MQPAFTPAFDWIRVINLQERTDRRAQMTAELKRVGIVGDQLVEFVAGVRPNHCGPFRRVGELGVFLSHLKILRAANEQRVSVLVLEDDVDFTAAVADGKVQPGIQIYYGGYVAGDPQDLFNSDIIGAHCMGFSADILSLLVPFLEGLLDHPSPPPIDGAYVWFRRKYPEVRTQFAEPAIAIQRPSRSDIARLRFFDRAPILRQAVSTLRKVKRAMMRI